jgi:hypothetical protein
VVILVAVAVLAVTQALAALEQLSLAQTVVTALAVVVLAGKTTARHLAREWGFKGKAPAVLVLCTQACLTPQAALVVAMRQVGLRAHMAAVARKRKKALTAQSASSGPATSANSPQHAQQTNKEHSWNTHNLTKPEPMQSKSPRTAMSSGTQPTFAQRQHSRKTKRRNSAWSR